MIHSTNFLSLEDKSLQSVNNQDELNRSNSLRYLEVRSRLTRRRAESAIFELWCITSHSDMIVVWRNQAFALTIWVLSANACFRQLCCSIAVKEAHHEQTHSDNCVRNSDRFVTECIGSATRRHEAD